MSGNIYWLLDPFLAHYPTLEAAFRIPFDYAIDLDYFQDGVAVRKRRWPTFWRWLTFGRGAWTSDCLCVVLDCLRAAGIKAPKTIATPGGLFRWLRNEGYDHVTKRRSGKGFRPALRYLIVD